MLKKIPRGPAFVLAAVLLVWAVIAIFPRSHNYAPENPMRKAGELPILIAHGGGNGEFPDNTLEAFYNAYSVDQRVMIETDVSITKDGVVILSHDTTLDRKTNVTGAIADWNYADLISQKVDFGYTNPTQNDQLSGERKKFTNQDGNPVTPLDVEYPEGVIPRDESVFLATTLEELMTHFPENRISVEIKQEGDLGMRCLDEVLRLVKKHDAWDRVVFASFYEEVYDEYQRLQTAGEVPDTFMCSPAYDGVTEFFVMRVLQADVFFDDRMTVFQLPMEEYGIDLATQGMTDAAHKHNLAVHYWTINDPEDMKHLIEIGADGIMTDYPHRLKEVYDNWPSE